MGLAAIRLRKIKHGSNLAPQEMFSHVDLRLVKQKNVDLTTFLYICLHANICSKGDSGI